MIGGVILLNNSTNFKKNKQTQFQLKTKMF